MPYIGKQPANVPVTADDIPDNSITSAKILDGVITIADIANDAVTEDKLANSINTAIAANTAKTGITSGQASAITNNTAKVTNSTSASDLSSGTLPMARLSGTLPALDGSALTGVATDTSTIENNIAMLGFYRATDHSKAKYNLVDQVIDDYNDASGIDAANSTNELLSSGVYTASADGLAASATKEFAATNSSWAIASGSIIDKMIVIGGGGAGGQSNSPGRDYAAAGGGGGGWSGAVNYTIPTGITSANITIGAGGTGGGSEAAGNAGGASSIVFGSDFTLSANGGNGGSGSSSTSSGGAGGSATSSGSGTLPTRLSITGGGGGTGNGQGTGATGAAGSSGSLSGTTYFAAGGGGGGSGDGQGGSGGAGQSASYSGGGGGAGGDTENVNSGKAGGAGYGTAGESASIDGNEDGGSKTVDSTTVFGGIGTLHNPGATGTTAEVRDRNNAGGGGLFGGGGGGVGDGGVGNSSAHGAQGYVRVEYRAYAPVVGDLTLQSTDSTASTAPSSGDIVTLIENYAGTATLNTDIKGYISRDSGANFTQGTLVDEGSWGTNKKILAFHNLDISGQPSGTAICYKITTHNQSASKETRIHATSLAWA